VAQRARAAAPCAGLSTPPPGSAPQRSTTSRRASARQTGLAAGRRVIPGCDGDADCLQSPTALRAARRAAAKSEPYAEGFARQAASFAWADVRTAEVRFFYASPGFPFANARLPRCLRLLRSCPLARTRSRTFRAKTALLAAGVLELALLLLCGATIWRFRARRATTMSC